MSIFSKLFRKNKPVGNVDDFMILTRVYFQSTIALNVGITNINLVPDIAYFKRTFKVPTQNGKLGLAEKLRAKKMMMKDYGLSENFFSEIDASIKKNCRNQQQIQAYMYLFQSFATELMMLMANLLQWKYSLMRLFKGSMYAMAEKTVHDIVTKPVWKKEEVHKTAMNIRKGKERLGYSEQWMTEYAYQIIILTQREPKNKKFEEE